MQFDQADLGRIRKLHFDNAHDGGGESEVTGLRGVEFDHVF
jgi:hypothetical protein